MAGQEVAVVYVHVQPSTEGFATSLGSQMDKATPTVSKTSSRWGKSITSKLGSAFGTIGKVGLGAVTAIGGGIAGLAAKGGFDRALAIENAQAKLKGLHHDAGSIQGIMNSALASVKGTAFGLGDAATVAASLSASGVKAGDEMTSALKAVADVAAVSGMEMSHVGSIFGSVAARGKLQGDDLLQLSSNGVPALQALAEATGKTTAEVSDMVSKGQIDFKTFSDAMTKYVGGAALAMGETTTGAFMNLKAALGRLGEAFEGSQLNAARDIMNALTRAVDAATGALKPLAEEISNRLGPYTERVVGLIDRFAKGLEDGSVTIESAAGFVAKLAGGFGVLAGVGGNLDGLVETVLRVGDGMSGFGDKVGRAIDGAGNTLKAAPGKLRGFITGMGDTLTQDFGVLGTRLSAAWNSETRSMLSFDHDPFAELMEGMHGRIDPGLAKIRGSLKGGLAKVGSTITQSPITQSITGFASKIGDGFSSVASSVGGHMSAICTKIKSSPVGSIIGEVGSSISDALGTMGGAMQTALGGIGNVLGKFFSPGNFIKILGIGALGGALLAGIGAIDSSMGGAISGMINNIAAKAPEAIASFTSFVTGSLPQLMASGQQMLATILGALASNMPAIMTAGATLIQQLCQGLALALPQLIPLAAQVLTSLVLGLVQNIPLLIQGAMSLVQGLVQGIALALPVLMEAVPQIITAIVTALIEALPVILESGTQIINSLINGITQALPVLMGAMPVMVQQIGQAITDNLPLIIQTGVQLLTSLINGIVNAIPQLIAMLPTIIDTTVSILTQNLPAIIQAGVQILVALINGLVRAIPQLISYLPQIIATVVSTLMRNLPAIIQAGVQILVALVKGLVQAIPQLVAALPQCISAIKDGFSQVNWGEVGSQIINGIISGIGAMAGALWDSAVNVAKGALDKAKSWLGIHSPSRRFRDEVGKQIGAGMALGIEATEGDVAKAGQALAEASLPSSLPTPQFDVQTARAYGAAVSAYDTTVSPANATDPTQESILAALEALIRNLPGIIADYTPTIGQRDLRRLVA